MEEAGLHPVLSCGWARGQWGGAEAGRTRLKEAGPEESTPHTSQLSEEEDTCQQRSQRQKLDVRVGRYLIVCDIKILPTIRISLPAIITVKSSC